MYLKICRNERGIGLVEVIFALGVSVIVITSLVSLSLFTLRSSLHSKLLLQGTKLANQELELARALRDSGDWMAFMGSISPCMGGVQCNLGGFPAVSVGARTVTIDGHAVVIYFTIVDLGDPNMVRVAVEASWDIGGQTKYARNYTDLSNWRGV